MIYAGKLPHRWTNGRNRKGKDRLKKNGSGEKFLKWTAQREMPMRTDPFEMKKPTITIRLNPAGTIVTWGADNGSPRPNWRCVVEALKYFVEKLNEEDVPTEVATDAQMHQDLKAVSAMYEGGRYYMGRHGDYLVGWEYREGKAPAKLKRVPLPVLLAVIELLENVLED